MDDSPSVSPRGHGPSLPMPELYLPAGRRQRLALVILAAIGASLLLVVAVNRWPTPGDELAYWLAGSHLLAGQQLYTPDAPLNTPYAYWYPPPLAQIVAPIAAVLSSSAFSAAWTLLLLACLWWLSGTRLLVALALCVFVPVPVEFWFRNIHLPLAVLIVLGIRRWPAAFAIGAAVKIAPVLGLVYFAARGRWRDAAIVASTGGAILLVSAIISPSAWTEFASVVAAPGAASGASLVPVPYAVRAVVALLLAITAGRLPGALGESLLVVAIVVGSPSLYVTTFSMLVAILPIVEGPRRSTRVP